MKSSSSLLSPILRSETQGKLLAELFLHPDAEHSLVALAARVKVSSPTIKHDVDGLVASGFLTDRRVGRSRLVKANPEHPMFRPLSEIILYGFGPAVVIPELFAGITGIEKAYIYGSWAERYLGTPGPNPTDVDVLIVGDPDRSEVYEISRQATATVGRDVNINIITPERWNDPQDGFVRTVLSRPLLPLDLSEAK